MAEELIFDWKGTDRAARKSLGKPRAIMSAWLKRTSEDRGSMPVALKNALSRCCPLATK